MKQSKMNIVSAKSRGFPAFGNVFIMFLAVVLCSFSECSATDQSLEELPLSWHRAEQGTGVSEGHLLPEEIFLDMSSVTHERTQLLLKKKEDDVEHANIIAGYRGRDRIWKPNKHQHFSVYSDQENHASFSVAMNDKNDSKLLLMYGSFKTETDSYSVSPYRPATNQRMVASNLVSINGSVHVVLRDPQMPENFYADRSNDHPALKEQGYASIRFMLSDLEFEMNNKLYKKKSGEKQKLVLELFVILDYSIYIKWFDRSGGKMDTTMSDLQYYYSHIVNGISDRYASIKFPDIEMSVKLAGFYIARSRSEAPFTEDHSVKLNSTSVNVYRALDSLYDWVVKSFKERHKELPRFDATVLFTDYELTVVTNRSRDWRTISGVADIGSACKVNAVSICKDFGQYGTIDTATHEIGHNLGAQHDGMNNTCSSSDQFIMATSPIAVSDDMFHNPYKFSTCTLRYFREYIENLNHIGKNCLLDGANVDQYDSAKHLDQLLGQKFTLDEQCQLMYGKDSFYCAGGGAHGRNVCRGMFCYKPSAQSCVTDVRLRAADGTSCGKKAWCHRSRCVDDERALDIDDNCPHGDYRDKIPFWNTGTTECKLIEKYTPHLCYHEYYEDLCCGTCKKLKNASFVGCEYGDKNRTACAVIPSTVCYDSIYRHECCQTCVGREIQTTGLTDCKYGDKASWCTDPHQFRTSDCYRDSDKSICCKTCVDLKIGPPGCEYGDKGSGCTVDHCRSPTHMLYCCKTCEHQLRDKNVLGFHSTTKLPLTLRTTQTPKDECTKDKASWCSKVHPSECYRSSKTCCLTCNQYFNPERTDCEYGDKKSVCNPSVCSKGQWYLDNCCESCRKDHPTSSTPSTTKSTTTSITTTTETTTTSTATTTAKTTTKDAECPRGDAAPWCAQIKPTECYSSSHVCCVTCRNYFDDSSQDCPYGDKRSDCQPRYCTGSLKSSCCKTCRDVLTTTIATTATTLAASTTTKREYSGDNEIETSEIKNALDECSETEEDWCADLEPYECYDNYETCCVTCYDYFNKSLIGCEFGDKELSCSWDVCMEDDYYATSCCKTCRDMPQYSPTTTTTKQTTTTKNPKCPKGDTASWCSRIKPYDCYRSSHTCCETCPNYYDPTKKGCEYGDKRSDCDVTHCHKTSYSQFCCKTCQSVQTSTTTLKTTTTTTTTTTTKPTTLLTTTRPTTIAPLTKLATSSTTSISNFPVSYDETYIQNKCPKGDSASWCEQIKPVECYRSSKTCCKTCLGFYDRSKEGCEYGDKASWCESFVRKSLADCKLPTSTAATKCCKSCKEALESDPEYLIQLSYVRPTCLHEDQETYCSDIEPMECYAYYKTCCRACSAYFDATISECPYGDKVGWCKTHATSIASCNRKDVNTQCCRTCFYLNSDGKVNIPSVSGCDDIASWCLNVTARQCYHSTAETSCCKSCQKLRGGRTGACRYGDHVSWCEPQFCSSYPEECCASCA